MSTGQGVGAETGPARLTRFENGLWTPAGAKAETVSRALATSSSTPVTGQLQMMGLGVPAGTKISKIGFVSVNAAAAITHQWAALFDSGRGRLAVSNDEIATAWGAQTQKEFFLARRVTDAAIGTGTPTLTSATAAFTPADVGASVSVVGAGAAGAVLGTFATPVTIASVTNATTAVLSANAGTTVAAAEAFVGTPYTVGGADAALYVGFLMAATVGSLFAPVAAGVTGLYAVAPVLHGRADTALTTAATCPVTAATLVTAAGSGFYAYVA